MLQGTHWNTEWEARIRKLADRLGKDLTQAEDNEVEVVCGVEKLTGRKVLPPHTSIILLMEGMIEKMEKHQFILPPGGTSTGSDGLY